LLLFSILVAAVRTALPSSAKVKNARSSISTIPIHLHGMVLRKSIGTTLSLPYCINARAVC
jgi:hypothetical protein